MRGLRASRPDVPFIVEPDPNEMSPASAIGQSLSEHSWIRRRGNVGRPLPPKQGGADEQEEGYQCGNRVPWQPEQQVTLEAAKHKRPARFDGNLPKLKLPARVLERAFDEIPVSDRRTPRRDDSIATIESLR